MKQDVLTPAQRALIAVRQLRAETAALRSRLNEPIAIVAMACRLPGGVADPQAFWSLLAEGRSGLGPMPTDRWDVAAYFDPDPEAEGKIYVERGGFLDDIAGFDPALFEMEPPEIRMMDPQQRLLLELSWECLERANLAPSLRGGPDGPAIGVFVGMASSGYSRHSVFSGNPARIDRYSVTGFAPGIASGRISYLLGLQGPTLTVDTACSSSLVALHLACQSLRSRDCDAALAGAANLLVAPEEFVFFCKVAALSPTSSCRVFDADADGYVRGEGGGMVLLKRLSDAEREGDEIVAVIRGSAINHDGRSNGLTAPNGVSQAALLRRALRVAGTAPGEIGYVETHGTGTPLGDPIEVNALGAVLAEGRAGGQPRVPIGSCKSNIGHLEAAAGIAGVIKVVLALQHERIPASLGFETPNPHIDWAEAPVEVATALTSWPRREGAARVAGVSGFGFSGTNAHVILADPPTRRRVAEPAAPADPAELVVSAATTTALARMLGCLADWSETHPERTGADFATRLAGTLATGRALLYRAALIEVAPGADLPAALRSAAERIASGDAGALLTARMAEAARARASETVGQCLVLPTYPFERVRFWPDPEPGAEDTLRAPTETEQTAKTARFDTIDGETALAYGQRILAAALKLPPATVQRASGPGALGIDSVTLVRVRFLLEQGLGRSISIQAFSALGDWAGFAELLAPGGDSGAAPLEADSGAAHAPVAALDGAGAVPMTPLQEAYWVGRQIGPPALRVGSNFYLEFEAGSGAAATLETALNTLIQRHPMLRAEVAEGSLRILEAVQTFQVPVHCADAATLPELTLQIRSRLAQQTHASGAWPLFGVEAVRHDGGLRLHFGIDEMIADGASISLLLREWQLLACAGGGADLPALRYDFRQYAGFLAERRGAAGEDLDYWLGKCAELPGGPSLPMLASPASAARRRLKAVLGPDVLAGLRARAEDSGVSLTALVLGVFADTLAEATGDAAFSLVMTFFNRLPVHPDVDAIVGPVAATSLFIWRQDQTRSFNEALRACQEQLWQDSEHSRIDGVSVLRELRRRKAFAPVFRLPVVFTSMVENFASEERTAPDWSTDWTYAVSQTPQVLLDHQVGVRRDTLVISWDVAVGELDEAAVEHAFSHYGAALTRVASGGAPRGTMPGTTAGTSASIVPTAVQAAYAYGRMQSSTNCQVYQDFRVAELDIGRLTQVWNEMIARHEMLRASLTSQGVFDIPLVRPPYLPRIEPFDGTEPERLRAEMAISRRNPECWPLFELAASRARDGSGWIHLAIDMLTADWPSIQFIYRELFGRLTGTLPAPAGCGGSFAAYRGQVVVAERAVDRACATSYWRGMFETLPPARLNPPPEAGSAAHVRLGAELANWTGFVQHCAAASVAPQDALLAAFAEALLGLVVAPPVPIVVVDFSRHALAGAAPPPADCIGDFTTLAWVVDDGGHASFADLTRALAEQADADLARWPDSGVRFAGRFGPQRRAAQSPVLPFVFSRLLDFAPPDLPPGIALGDGLSCTDGVALDNVSVAAGDRLAIHWDLDPAVLERRRVEDALALYAARLDDLSLRPGAWTELAHMLPRGFGHGR